MPTLETLTETDIRNHFSNTSWSRSEKKVRSVRRPIRRGNELDAAVMGRELYEVLITVKPTDVSAICTCPYDWGGFCKHIGAVLRLWLQAPDRFNVESADSPSTKERGETLAVFTVDPPTTRTPGTLPTWLQYSYEQAIQEDRKDLAKVLQESTVKELRTIAGWRKWRLRGTRKDDLIEQLVNQLADPDECRNVVETLSSEQIFTLQALSAIDEFQSLTKTDLEMVIRQLGLPEISQPVSRLLSSLAERGLVVDGPGYGGALPSYIPRAVERSLPPLLTPSLEKSLPEESDAEIFVGDPNHILQTARQIIVALANVKPELRSPMPRPALERHNNSFKGWDYDPTDVPQFERRTPIKNEIYLTVPSPAYALPDEMIDRLLPFAGSKDRLDFVFANLIEAGIFQPGSPVTAWPEVYQAFLRRDLPEQHTVLARSYFWIHQWNELWGILRDHPAYRLRRRWSRYDSGTSPQGLQNELALFRLLVLKAVSALPEDEWIEMASIDVLLLSYWNRFDSGFWNPYTRRNTQRPSHSSWHLDYRGSVLIDPEDRHLQSIQLFFIRAVLEKPLFWLGLADLRRRNGVLTHVRVHGLRDLFLWRTPHLAWDQQSAEQGRRTDTTLFTVDGDQVRVDPVEVHVQGHALLERCAQLVETTPEAFTYRLDVATAHRTFEGGVALESIYADWETHLGAPTPPSIRALLDGWWNAYGKIRIYDDVTVIEFGDDHALTEMRAVTSLEKLPYAEISPRLILIPQGSVDQLIGELEKGGYTPRRIDSQQNDHK